MSVCNSRPKVGTSTTNVCCLVRGVTLFLALTRSSMWIFLSILSLSSSCLMQTNSTDFPFFPFNAMPLFVWMQTTKSVFKWFLNPQFKDKSWSFIANYYLRICCCLQFRFTRLVKCNWRFGSSKFYIPFHFSIKLRGISNPEKWNKDKPSEFFTFTLLF